MIGIPALLGNPPAFSETVPVARPTMPSGPDVLERIGATLRSGQVTNGAQVRAFEEETAEFLNVPHVVAVSSCTTGLLLLLRCLGLRGKVVVPSFTFMATGHAVVWNGMELVFADSDPLTCTLDPESVAAVAPGAAAILAVHTFGAPCDTERLQAVANDSGSVLLFDAAHGFGGRYPDGTMIGSKGLAEVFSLSPTKTLSAGEGGLISTGDASLARDLRTARVYGNAGGYDATMVGLSGRLPEMAAILGRAALPMLPSWLSRRRELAARYQRNLSGIPGLGFQSIMTGAESSVKDFTVRVDPEFGLERDELATALAAENVETRPYFDPPLHRQAVYRNVPVVTSLAGTDRLSATSLTLPMHSLMQSSLVDRICAVIHDIHRHAERIAGVLRAADPAPQPVTAVSSPERTGIA
ncbi:DegT/DnrJ/EryC1/StrS family aminotransferase [Micromonospora sp. CPCC 205539]|uniref:DegT/DnrJ/EryC1/StrS family aminotransferase n=1 Tax=Micromonospora sp. CPCC 205539 TaxID=3122408 RepID=UPI002FEF44A1